MQVVHVAKFSLLGRIIADKLLNKKKVKAKLIKGWDELVGLSIIDLGTNMFIFIFETKEDARRIFDNTP